jgi:DNA-binding PadR family transcriptional regulator
MAQLVFRPLEVYVLSQLLLRSQHGYQLAQQAQQEGLHIGYGSIYHTLRKLSYRQLLTCQIVSAPHAPNRTVYSVHPAQAERVRTLLRQRQVSLQTERVRLTQQYREVNIALRGVSRLGALVA